MTFCEWLDARDGESMARAWGALAAKSVVVSEPEWRISRHGAARLAAAFLGWPLERLAWLGNEVVAMGKPAYEHARNTHRCFLEYDLDLREECCEYVTIHELREGERGVQHVSIGYQQFDGTRDGRGDGSSVVRIFDRATATGASIGIGAQTIATIGDVDVAALDLFDHQGSFDLPAWDRHDPERTVRLLAELATLLDAHYAGAAAWPSHVVRTFLTPMTDPASPGTRYTTTRYESAARAIELSAVRFDAGTPDEHGWVTATVHGLPWGHWLDLVVYDEAQRISGRVSVRSPLAVGKAVMARARGLAVTDRA